MSKRVLVSLFVAAGIFFAARNGRAQQAEDAEPNVTASTFQPGAFLTGEDYEYLQAALGCINLSPADLSYEKKHKPNDKLRLKVCDAALDDPLGVPRTAELAAREFASHASATGRAIHAGALLDLPQDRWTAEQLQKDGEKFLKLLNESKESHRRLSAFEGDHAGAQYKKLEAEDKKATEAVNNAENAALFGETPVALTPDKKLEAYGRVTFGSEFVAAANALTREGARLSQNDMALLGAEAAQFMADDFELMLPGGRKSEAGLESDVFELCERVEIAPVLVAAARLWSILETAAAGRMNDVHLNLDYTKGSAETKVEGVTGNIVSAWQSKWGKVVIGGTGPNTYEGDDFIGIIDLGGDDTYKGRVACGIGLEGHAPISFVLDLGGNDRYEGGDFTQGFGFLGVGILHDLGAGNDFYSAGFCAQGCGLCGYGELYDDGGDDIYRADSGAQGAGCFGYGQLTDVAGNDTYRGARYVQGFAQVMGVGVLTDGAGNDSYYAGGKYLHQPLWNDRYQSLSQGFAIGNRNDSGVGTGGGVALLLDEGDGNDVYTCDIYGQGSSYWYSLGMLVDTGGNDTFTLGQYGQGAGIHLSAAILVDLAGNDTYSMGVGLGQGAAHDWAVGWQIDRAGNDFYQGNGQGMGLNFSFGILLDCAGDDSHSTNNEGSIGKGTNNDISVLLDLAGTDVYGPKDIKDGVFNRRGDHQIVFDVPKGWFPNVDVSTLPTTQDPAPETVKVQHILISWKDANTRVTPKDPESTKAQAEALRDKLLKQARTKGADWSAIQADHNEDTVADTVYTVTQDAPFVKPFLNLSLKLGKGQIDWCETSFGYHIIKRIE